LSFFPTVIALKFLHCLSSRSPEKAVFDFGCRKVCSVQPEQFVESFDRVAAGSEGYR
jgi:hypothetical protein